MVMEELLSPFRKVDADEALKLIQDNGFAIALELLLISTQHVTGGSESLS